MVCCRGNGRKVLTTVASSNYVGNASLRGVTDSFVHRVFVGFSAVIIIGGARTRQAHVSNFDPCSGGVLRYPINTANNVRPTSIA